MKSRALLIVFTLFTLITARANADDMYPTRPIRLVVAYAAGGSGDLIARLLGQQLSVKVGQQIVVENKPGGGGVIGTDYAARSLADGYTLYLAATAGPLTAGSLLGRRDYQWRSEFKPVALAAIGHQVLLVSPKLTAKNLKDFIMDAKSEPNKYNIASIGIGSAPHLASELFQSKTGTQMVHVPFNGSSAQAVMALIGGDVQAFIVGTSTVVPMIQAGQLPALAVTAQKRIETIPDVPSFHEQGLDFQYDLWFAVMAQRGVPDSIVGKLNTAINEIIADASYVDALKLRGFNTKPASVQDIEALLDEDTKLNAELVKRLDIK